VGCEAQRSSKAKSPKTQAVDCRQHALTVFDGTTMVGSLVERAGAFHSYDLEGRYLGAFGDMRMAARAIPPAASLSRQGKHVYGAVDLQRDRSRPSPKATMRAKGWLR
jgi:hypothetical protein